MKPTLQVNAFDSDTGLRSFVVVDRLVDGTAMGGTRMTGTVTMEEVAELARKMTLKLALAGIRMGGAKAGIVCDMPASAERDRRLRAFGRMVRPLLRGGVYLGSDQGVSHTDRDLFFDAASFNVRHLPHAQRLSCEWAELWHACEDITGFGVCEGTLAGVEHLEMAQRCQSVAIQGFGAVGRAVAIRLAARGIRVVAVADRLGTVSHPSALPIEALLAATDALGTIDRALLPRDVVLSSQSDAWLDVPADVLVLAAGGGAVHAGNVARVRAALVVEGANFPCTDDALRALDQAGTPVLPDIVLNCGGAAVTGLILTGVAPVDAPLQQLQRWLYDEIARRIRHNVALLFERARAERCPLSTAANDLADERVAALAQAAPCVAAAALAPPVGRS